MITLTQDQLIDFALALSVASQYIKVDEYLNQVHTRLKELSSILMEEYNEDPIAVEQLYVA